MKVIRNWGRKWEEGKKREGAAAKMTSKFEVIMTKEETCVARNKVNEGRKVERLASSWRCKTKSLRSRPLRRTPKCCL